MQIYNSHIHTEASPDCTEALEDICRSAVSSGISGISITDHCSGSLYILYNSYGVLKSSHQNAKRMAREYSGKLDILSGVEFDEMTWSPDYINRLIKTFDFDVILASVHRVQNTGDNNYLSRINFSSYTQNELEDFVGCYFNDVLKTVKSCDFDVLSHLTIVLRYICGKYKREFNIRPFNNIIDEILKELIKRDKALELNTSEVFNIGLMPDSEILARYKVLGGKKITIGTDAHRKENLLKGFDMAARTLRDLGFDSYYYYKNRQPVKVEL